MARLGVNVDHVATLRQVRGEAYPSVIRASEIALESGADQITIHLREDRRHIQDTDVESVRLLTRKYQKLFNLEMAATEEMKDTALLVTPDWVCLVPEKREEQTTEGGLNLLASEIFETIKRTCEELKEKKPEIKISLFLEAEKGVLARACELGSLINAVEIHTGEFARAFNEGNTEVLKREEKKYVLSYQEFFRSGELGFHAGHGLKKDSLRELMRDCREGAPFSEFNIGHWIIAEAIFQGLGKVVSELKSIINESEQEKLI